MMAVVYIYKKAACITADSLDKYTYFIFPFFYFISSITILCSA